MFRWPPPVAEIATEEFRPKLLAGIFTGYTTVALLLVAVLGARAFEALPGGSWAFVLVGTKLVTNTAAWIAWRKRTLLIELSALNIAADVFVMTGAIYFTGGILSPLYALYFVEIAVMALLTNMTLTITTTLGCFVFYAGMALAVHVGALPALPPLATSPSQIGTPLLMVLLGVAGLATFAPGVYVALIVEQLRRNERALRARAEDLVEAGRAKSEFTANITHELRTPLHGIMGMGELIEDGVYGPVTPRQIEAVHAIRGNARGLLELIDSLLVLARAEALRLELSTAPVDLAEVIASVAASARMLAGRRKLDLRVALPESLPVVHTDRRKLVQILVNLIANAIKFTPDAGHIEIAASLEEDSVRIDVRDTGRGISAEMLPTIFEPYVQGDGSPVREHGGAGIGLSVVRTLADLLHVEVAVQSEVGRGSTFTLRVPHTPKGASVSQ